MNVTTPMRVMRPAMLARKAPLAGLGRIPNKMKLRNVAVTRGGRTPWSGGENASSGNYTDLLKDIQENQVVQANVAQNMNKLQYVKKGDNGQEIEVILPRGNDILETLLEHNVPVNVQSADGKNVDYLGLFSIFFQIVFLVALARTFMSRTGGGDGGSRGVFGFGNAIIKEVDAEKMTTRFDDVAGVEGAKQDLQEVVDFLKNPERYVKLGAKVPRGVLLVGLPGTGKTLLAKAVAGEASVPFFECSASSFVEMFVGTGAARVRDLFNKAKQKAPCIVFIDEIDAIGKTRSAGGMSNSNDEREQTINQLLTAMDGFADNSGVIVLAASNRPEILDEALLRPGRFDRKVHVDLPDLHGRQAILKIHTNGKPLDEDVKLESIARVTVGFSGADLANLSNEAAIYAARDSAETIKKIHWDRALEKITIGEEKPTALITEKKRRITAYHEAGHALLGLLVDDFDEVRKVTIVPRGRTGGVTYFQPSDERVDSGLVSRQYLENQIIVSLGGRVAEEMIFGTMHATTGAEGDFQHVMDVAYNMVASYGFNETMGPIGWSEGPIDVSADIAAEMKTIVEHCYHIAHDRLEQNEFYLHRIAEALLERETLEQEDIRNLTYGLSLTLPSPSERDS